MLLFETKQQGKHRAEFGKGYLESALKRYRKLYSEFQGLQIQQTLSTQFKEHFSKIGPPLLAQSTNCMFFLQNLSN